MFSTLPEGRARNAVPFCLAFAVMAACLAGVRAEADPAAAPSAQPAEAAPSTPPSAEPVEAEPAAPLSAENACDDDEDHSLLSSILFGIDPLELTMVPQTLLWETPIANLREPRMFVMPNSLKNTNAHDVNDTGVGGTARIWRLSPESSPQEGIQFDIFGGVFNRESNYHILEAIDYHFGLPLSFASGPWEGKLSYEHTSTHLGDDFIKKTGVLKTARVRDEIVTGLSYRFGEDLRVYTEIGYAAMTLTSPGPRKRDRYDFGVEWNNRRPTTCWGAPYAALDFQLIGDEDYTPDLSVQAGWQWTNPTCHISTLRVGLEAYDGRSPYGQFFQTHENFVGLGVFFDF